MISRAAAANMGLPRSESVLLWIAVLWGVALVIAAVTVPTYTGTTASSDGTVTHSSATLYGENGVSALIIVCVPLLAALAVTGLLHRGKGHRTDLIAWLITALLIGGNVLALLSVGLFVLPVTVCLALACAIHTGQPAAPAQAMYLPDPDQHPR